MGGWQNLLQFVQPGFEVGFASEQAVASTMNQDPQSAKPNLSIRKLDEKDFPPDSETNEYCLIRILSCYEN